MSWRALKPATDAPTTKMAKNLLVAKFRGKLVFPSSAGISHDAEARRELLALAAGVEGGPPPDLPPVLPPVLREMPPVPVVALQSPTVGLNEENEEEAEAPTATPSPEDADRTTRRHRPPSNGLLKLSCTIQELRPTLCRQNPQTPTMIWRVTYVGCGRSNRSCQHARSGPRRSKGQAEVDAPRLGSPCCLSV